MNLLYEPWLPTVGISGEKSPVGLVGAIERAHELRWLDAEAPPVTAALHRLLLAFAHRVHGPENERAWARLWDAREFPSKPLEEYIERYGDRFELFGDRPFFQTPGVPDSKVGSAAQLTMYRASGNNATLFDHTTHDDQVELTPAEAAQWLVTVQAFDTGGMKTPYDKDKSSKAGLCNRFATLLLEGATLKETLLLNMPVYSPEWSRPPATGIGDHPIWERDDPPGPRPVKDEGPPPRGWTELLTWPSRRIRLRAADREDGPRVVGAAILPGTRLRAELHDVEQMAAFYREKQYRKGARGAAPKPVLGDTRPVVLEDLRGVWRHAREILLPAGEMGERIRPRTLDHIAEEVRREHLPTDKVVTARVFGQRLDPQAGAVHAWLEESLPVPVALLRAAERAPELEPLLGHAVSLADDIGDLLNRLERDYAAALGDKPSPRGPNRCLLTQWYWPELPAPFGVLLRDVGEVLVDRSSGGRDGHASLLCDLFDAWGRRVRSTAGNARTRWASGAPRERPRDLLALAACDEEFGALSRKRYRDYELAVSNHRPNDDGDSDTRPEDDGDGE